MHLHADCFSLSLTQIDKACEKASIDETVFLRDNKQANISILDTVRTRMVQQLIRAAPERTRHACVLIPGKQWNKVQAELEVHRRWSKLWKHAARRYRGGQYHALNLLEWVEGGITARPAARVAILKRIRVHLDEWRHGWLGTL